VTHAIVHIPKESDAKQSGVMAVVDLCFGQGDNAISGIRYVKSDGRMAWHAPMIQVLRDGAWISLPVFKGELLVEVCKLASQAVARIKKQFGSPAWNKQYLVLKDRVILQDAEGKEA
jgi:hypothetical protein